MPVPGPILPEYFSESAERFLNYNEGKIFRSFQRGLKNVITWLLSIDAALCRVFMCFISRTFNKPESWMGTFSKR